MRSMSRRGWRRMLMASAGLVAGLGLYAPSDAFAWVEARGARGGAVAAGPRGAVAVGPQGGVAAAGRYGGAAAVGPRGGAYARSPAYPAYRPPVAGVRPVPVYPGYAVPPPVGGMVAAGVVAGVAAGATAGAMARAAPPQTAVVVPSGGGAMPIGTEFQTLPSGCGTQNVGGVGYFVCGGSWLRAYMQGPNVVYLVVPPP
jgi:hypothetical protein